MILIIEKRLIPHLHTSNVIFKNYKLEKLKEFCMKHALRNAFALWDLEYERNRTDFYVDWENGIKGYMLVYHGGSVPSVIVQGSEDSFLPLISTVSFKKAILHFPYSFCHLWNGHGEIYKIDVMSAEPQYYGEDDNVRVIRNPKSLLPFFSDPEYLVNQAITFGLFNGKEVLSVASALVHLPEVWVLGAVVTRENMRNRGYATRVLRHFMSIAYGKTKNVVLWVRSDNEPAIHIYKKFGFEKIDEECWVNIGISIIP